MTREHSELRVPDESSLPSTDRRQFLLGAVGAGIAATLASAPAAAQDANGSPQALTDPRTSHPRKLPPQKQAWPGLQRDMRPRPDCGEKSYRGSGRLAGRRALITGGDSGIGRAIAIAYAREGADVVINHLPQENPDAAEVLELIQREGRKAASIPGDLRSEAFCRELIQKSAAALGGLDILVNNAGYGNYQENILELSSEIFDQTLKTNLYAPFWLSKAAIPHLKPGSSILFTASVAAFSPSGIFVDYSASKAGIVAMTKALAQQLGSSGIRVNAVAPGAYWTPIQATAGAPASLIGQIGDFVPLGRYGQPAEIAPLYVTLAEGGSSYVSGSVWSANGGTGVG